MLALSVASPAVAVAPSSAPVGQPAQANGGLTVKDVHILGPVDQNAHVAARDNGQSVEYHGKSYWFFDDTMLQDPTGFLSSTAAVTTDLDASDGISVQSANPFDLTDTSSPTEFVPYSAAETQFQNAHASSDCSGSTDVNCGTQFAFWPGSVVADPAHQRILVFYGKLCRGGLDTGPCASGFVGQALGSGIVSVDMRTHQITRLNVEHQDSSLTSPEGEDPTLLFSPSQNFGNGGTVLVGNELYAYGNCTNTNACGVARAPIDRVQDRAAWSFYAGTANGRPVWSADAASSVAVMNGGAAGETVHFDPATKLYMNSYMPFLSHQVYYQTSATPWGPWSAPDVLYTAPTTSGVEYAAFAHPEYTTDHGLTRYYTYYTSSTGQQILVRVDFTKG
ncbi:DUF4185 domain-containing protein [Leifsonia sp. SIMBA_070]|uniref:DUF4185 domain-containing protein n=1 Tax=Leifsonia sp. SIMBA_070 TaxID=3085810 RepID=UPI00397ACC9B